MTGAAHRTLILVVPLTVGEDQVDVITELLTHLVPTQYSAVQYNLVQYSAVQYNLV